MNRRDFLRSTTHAMLVLPFGTFLVGACGNDERLVVVVDPTAPPPDDATPPDAPARVEGSNIVYTSSRTAGHAHQFTLALDALAALPTSGASGDTTREEEHRHRLAIARATLERVVEGESVTVATDVADAHIHLFTIVRLA